MRARWVAFGVLLLAGCARVGDHQTQATQTPYTTGYGGLVLTGQAPPGRRPPPSPAYSSETSLLRERVAEAIRLYDRERWERFVDATDPGEFLADLRPHQESIDAAEWKKEWLFQLGDDLFEHELSYEEGYGPGRFRIHRQGLGGPDAGSCAECHHRGGLNGAGDVSQNAFFDGDGKSAESALERNPPHALGLGVEQRIAEEMTAQLTAMRENAVENAKSSGMDQRVLLIAKRIDFGSITARKDGSLDTSHVDGVDPDLVVKPFGWKGNFGSLRRFVVGGFQGHFGIQVSSEDAPGAGPKWDRDQDGMPEELSDGMLTSMLVYLSELEVPVMLPPHDPTLAERHEKGEILFEKIGCAGCHVPSLPLYDPNLRISPTVSVNVLTEGESPRPRINVFGEGIDGVPVFLFSDLKRHSMGAELAESHATQETLDTYETPGHRATAVIPADVFLTRPLWGLAETAPYLHDGRASTIDEAILAHGGEGKPAREAFATLSKDSRADLRIFLLSLSRYPRIDYR